MDSLCSISFGFALPVEESRKSDRDVRFFKRGRTQTTITFKNGKVKFELVVI